MDSLLCSRQTTVNECDSDCMFSVEESGSSREDTASSLDSGFGGRGDTASQGEEGRGIRIRERVSRPSCVTMEVEGRKLSVLGHREEVESVLGLIHLDLARYHETCRFDAVVQDKASALFHLRAAADCSNLQALIAISQLFTGRPNDILPAITQMDAEELVDGALEDIGLDYIVRAARQGDSTSMLYLAQAYDTGLNLGSDREQSYKQALDWYLKAAEIGAERSYTLLARVAEILLLEESGCRAPTRAAELFEAAAEAAMEDMKGKLATK